jgi:chitodextrinase
VIGYQLERCSGQRLQHVRPDRRADGDELQRHGAHRRHELQLPRARVDAAGNLGGYSLVASATTPAPDLTRPTTPTGLTATAVQREPGQPELERFDRQRGGDRLHPAALPGRRMHALGHDRDAHRHDLQRHRTSRSTTYRYWVRATDAAGNLSPWLEHRNGHNADSEHRGLVAAYGFDEGNGHGDPRRLRPEQQRRCQRHDWTTGKFGNALVFNGTSAQVTIPMRRRCSLTTAMTLEAWVFPTSTTDRVARDRRQERRRATTSWPPPTTAIFLAWGQLDQWQQNCIRPHRHTGERLDAPRDDLRRSTIRLFVNGVQVASVAQTAPLSPTRPRCRSARRLFDRVLRGPHRRGAHLQPRARCRRDPGRHGHVRGQRDAASARGRYHATERARHADRHGIGLDADQSRLGRATDNVGVTGYRVERCAGAGCSTFAQIATPTATSFSDTGLTAGTSYSYQVRATDAAGNLGPYSVVASGVTLALPDTTPPSAPGGLAAVATSQTQISVSWTAATDNVGVIGYQLERCSGSGCATFAQIAAPSATSFNDTGLTASTSYSYRARAVDGAGNLGGYSAVASATTLASDLTAPTTPTGLTATAASASQVNLSWTASTDNVAVTGYILQRCWAPDAARG